MQNDSVVRTLVRALRAVLGQKMFYRAVRLLMYEATFDVLNDPATNGEAYLQQVVVDHSEQPIIFDIGANVGDWTGMLLKQRTVPLTVHAFEPCDETFRILSDRVKHPGVKLVRAACSSEPGKARMSVTAAGAGTNSLSEGDIGPEVDVVTVDSYCQCEGIPRISLLKVDAEGYDLLVLYGASELLAAKAIEVIQFEYNHRWMATRKLLKDAFDFLKPLGYSVGKLSGNAVQFYEKWTPELETYREGNYVACLPRWEAQFHRIPARWN